MYGLRGVTETSDSGDLLDLDYRRSTLDVYRNLVKAALIDFKKVNGLLYAIGKELPSWLRRWTTLCSSATCFDFGKLML
jgi:hypothetical protein